MTARWAVRAADRAARRRLLSGAKLGEFGRMLLFSPPALRAIPLVNAGGKKTDSQGLTALGMT